MQSSLTSPESDSSREIVPVELDNKVFYRCVYTCGIRQNGRMVVLNISEGRIFRQEFAVIRDRVVSLSHGTVFCPYDCMQNSGMREGRLKSRLTAG